MTRTRRVLDALRRFDSRGELVALARAGRRRLPGDARYGDPLSLTGDDAPGVLGRGMTAWGDARPSALREVGMGALQVWQNVSETRGRGHGDRDVAIVFTDLVGFSEWVLDVGDDAALDLLRRVGHAVEEPVRAERGRVVKRLGDGLMAAFDDPAAAVRAACAASSSVGAFYPPGLRAGVHVGRPRRLGGDYFGVDVNVAARVAGAASGGEVLVSDAVRERLDPDQVSTRRRWRFRAKGAPRDLRAFVAEPAPQT